MRVILISFLADGEYLMPISSLGSAAGHPFNLSRICISTLIGANKMARTIVRPAAVFCDDNDGSIQFCR